MRIIKSKRLYDCFTKLCTCVVVCLCLMTTAAYAASFVPLKATEIQEIPSGEKTASEEPSYTEESGGESKENSFCEVCEESEESTVTELSEEETAYADKIPAVSLSQYTLDDIPVIKVIDQTGYSPDVSEYADSEITSGSIISDKPTVLIYHTHGTECYSPSGTYPDGYEFNTTDTEENVVAVGDFLSECLEELGICVIHDRTMYDADGYTTAYSRSKKAVNELLAAYPSIKYVIDIHGDSVESEGRQAKTVTLFDEECAQLMIVVGTDAGGSCHSNWEENFSNAVKLQETMNEYYPTLARPIYLRTASFNQELCAGALLIEVGSCGNTLEEAKNSARLLASSLEKTFR